MYETAKQLVDTTVKAHTPASLQFAISEIQAPASSCLAEPSLWPDTKRERVAFCCRVLPCDVVSVLLGQRPLQKHFVHIGEGWSLFNQAMLNQNALIRRCCQRRWMGHRSALALFWVFHCNMLTRFLTPVISWCGWDSEARQ